LLAALDQQPALAVELADVAGVEPAVFESRGVFRRGHVIGSRAAGATLRVVVPLRHVFPADEDLSVGGNADFHASTRCADGAGRRLEGMIQRDDRRGFGETVPLNNEKSQLPPERFELGLERRGAADQAPELPAKETMALAVAPPPPEPMLVTE